MSKDYQQLWNSVTNKTDQGEAIRILADILTEKEGRIFASHLELNQGEVCIEILDHVSHKLRLFSSLFKRSLQGIIQHDLKPPEKNNFLITLRRLAERYQLLPGRITITEGLEVLDEILAFGGFGDVRCGTYMGRNVAVKTTRIPVVKDFQRVRKVNIDGIFASVWSGLDRSPPAILQGSRSLGHTIPSKRLETRWSSGGHEEPTTRHRFRVDGARDHHGIYRNLSLQQTRTSM